MKSLIEKTKELQEHGVMVFNYQDENGILIYDYDLDTYGIDRNGLQDNGTGRYFLPVAKINDKLFADLNSKECQCCTTYTHSYLDDEDSYIIDKIDFGKVHNFENEQKFFYDWETLYNIRAFDLEMDYCTNTNQYYMWQSYLTTFANELKNILDIDAKDEREHRIKEANKEWNAIVEECHKYDVEPQSFDGILEEITTNY